MTTSEVDAAYVWMWLPDTTDPVVAGRLRSAGGLVRFTYGRSYLERDGAIPLFLPELPLATGPQVPLDGMHIAGCIADAGPDAWGQQVILHARGARDVGPLTFLLESGSDRTGALDFQVSAADYAPRVTHAPLDELLDAADRLDTGESLDPTLAQALLHGSSLGGARPKVHLDAPDGRKLIAKLSRRSDTYPVVNAEGAAMDLAGRAGLGVAGCEVFRSGDIDVLLVERFDRTPVPGERRMVVSALTILQLDEAWGRYATYTGLAEQIRRRFVAPDATLRELFGRIALNICVGNIDDHGRNHAAFWDGRSEALRLTPAYDICPQPRSVGEVEQAMAFGPGGERRSRLEPLVAAHRHYHLEVGEARGIVDHIVDTVRSEWPDAADRARLTAADRDRLWGAQILNPSIFYAD